MPNNIESLEKFRGIRQQTNTDIPSTTDRSLSNVDRTLIELSLMSKDRKLYDDLTNRDSLYKSNIDFNLDPTYGSSRFDNRANTLTDLQDLTDLRAREQTQLGKLGNAVVKTAGKTITTTFEILTMIPTAVAAIPKRSNDPNLPFSQENNTWRNRWMNLNNNVEWLQEMFELDEEMEKKFPNYRSYKEQDALWTRRMITPKYLIDFWGDDILKNLGFSWGTLLGARLVTKGLLAPAAKLGAQAGRSIRNSVVENSVKAARMSTRQLQHELGKKATIAELKQIIADNTVGAETQAVAKELLKRQRNLGIFESVNGSVISAVGEANLESTMLVKEILADQTKRLNDWFNNENNNKHLRLMYNEYVKTHPNAMSFEEYKQHVYDEAVVTLHDKAFDAGEWTFWLEAGLLSINNFLVFRRFFNSGFGSHTIGRNWNVMGKLGKKIDDATLRKMFRVVEDENGRLLRVETNFSKLSKIEPFAPIFVEGGEEMGQRYISSWAEYKKGVEFNDYFAQYYDDVFNDKYKHDAETAWYNAAYAFKNTFDTSEGWMEGFSGAVLGILGGLNFRSNTNQNKLRRSIEAQENENQEQTLLQKLKDRVKSLPRPTLEGGTISQLKALHNAEKLVQQCVNYVNEYYSNSEKQEQLKSMLRSIGIASRMNQAIVDNDAKAFKDEEVKEILEVIHNFHVLGLDEYLNQILDEVESTESLSNMSEIKSAFDEYKERLKPEDQTISADEFINRVIKEVKAWREVFNTYEEYRDTVERFLGDAVSDEAKHMVTQIAVEAKDKYDRAQSLMKKVIDSIDKSLGDKLSTLSFEEQMNVFINGDETLNIPAFQSLVDQINKLLEEYNNANNGEETLTAEEKEKETNRVIDLIQTAIKDQFLNMFPTSIETFNPNLPTDIVDLFLLFRDYVDLTNAYKRYLSNIEWLKTIDNVMQNTKVSDDGETSAETPTDSVEDFLAGLSGAGNETADDGMTWIDNISKFIEKLKEYPDLISSEELKQQISEASSVGEVEDLINNFIDKLHDILDTYSVNDPLYKQANEILDYVDGLNFTINKTSDGEFLQQRTSLIDTFAQKVQKLVNDNPSLDEAFRKNHVQINTNGSLAVVIFQSENTMLSLVEDPVKDASYLMLKIGNFTTITLPVVNSFEIISGKPTRIFMHADLPSRIDGSDVIINVNKFLDTVFEQLNSYGFLTEELKSEIKNAFESSYTSEQQIVNGIPITKISSVVSGVPTIRLPLTKYMMGATGDNDALHTQLRSEIYQLAKTLQDELRKLEHKFLDTSTTTSGTTTAPSVSETHSEPEPVEETESETETPVEPEVKSETTPEIESEPEPEVSIESSTTESETPEVESETVDEDSETSETNKELLKGKRRENDQSAAASSLSAYSPFAQASRENYNYTNAATEYDVPSVKGNQTPTESESEYHDRKNQKSNIVYNSAKAHLANPNFTEEEVEAGWNMEHTALWVAIHDKCVKDHVYDFVNTHTIPIGTKLIFSKPEDAELAEAVQVNAVLGDNVVCIGYLTPLNERYFQIKNSGIKNNRYNLEGKITDIRNGQVHVQGRTEIDQPSEPIPVEAIEKQLDENTQFFIGFFDQDDHLVSTTPNDVNSTLFNNIKRIITDVHNSNEPVANLLTRGIVNIFVSRKPGITSSNINDYAIKAVKPKTWNRETDNAKLSQLAKRIYDLQVAISNGTKTSDELSTELTTLNKILRSNFVFRYDESKGENSITARFQLKIISDSAVMINVETYNIETKKFATASYIDPNTGKTKYDNFSVLAIQTGKTNNGTMLPSTTMVPRIVNFLMNQETLSDGTKHSTPVQSITADVINGNGKALDLNGNSMSIVDLIKNGQVLVFNELQPYNVGLKYEVDTVFEKEATDPVADKITTMEIEKTVSETTEEKVVEDVKQNQNVSNDGISQEDMDELKRLSTNISTSLGRLIDLTQLKVAPSSIRSQKKEVKDMVRKYSEIYKKYRSNKINKNKNDCP